MHVHGIIIPLRSCNYSTETPGYILQKQINRFRVTPQIGFSKKKKKKSVSRIRLLLGRAGIDIIIGLLGIFH